VESLGRYELSERIGAGGMGTVYRARDTQLGRAVAVKILREGGDARVRERFEREARAAARLAHPNVVTVYDAGEIDGRMFIAMELVEGEGFDSLMARPSRDLRWKLGLVEKVARAVGHAHRLGIVHRDLKPGNILVTPGGEPKVGDFGLAHLLDADKSLTRSGVVVGTPMYMAPEQARGVPGDIGPRTDVYALGAILYQLLTGRVPHDGESTAQIYHRIITDEPVRPRDFSSKIDASVETIALKAIEKDPGRRYATADALAEDLHRYLEGEPILACPPGVASRVLRRVARHRVTAAAAMLVLLSVSAVAIAWRSRVAEREHASYRRVQERVKRAQAVILETRPFFYAAGVDVRPKLDGVEVSLRELEEVAGEGGGEVWGLIGLGRHLLGDDRRAEEALLKAEQAGWVDGRLQFTLGRLYLERSIASFLVMRDETIDERRKRAREWSERALARLRRPLGPVGELDRDVAEVYLLFAEDRDDEVLRRCEAGLGRHRGTPGCEDYWMLIALVHDGERRIEACTQALAVRPHYFWARFVRGNTWHVSGGASRALADYDEAARLNPTSVWTFVNRASLHTDAGNPDAGIADADRALAIDATCALAWLNRGNAKLRKGDRDGAGRDFEDALRHEPAMLLALLNRGAMHVDTDIEAALRHYDDAVRIRPDATMAYVWRGMARMAKGDRDGARADYTKALAIDPRDERALNNLGVLLEREGDRDGALAAYDTAIDVNPRNARARVNRANILRARGRHDEARREYDEAVRLDPTLPDVYLTRAYARREWGDAAGAVADADAVLKLDPTHAEALVCRGLLRREADDPTGAMADYDAAIRVAPACVDAYVNRGVLREKLGQVTDALADYDEAIRINPRCSAAYANRGILHHTQGRTEAALADYGRALDTAPADWPHREKIRGLMERLRPR